MQINNMKWTESETIKLVELYGEFPSIWDISRRDYKDKNKRNAAYEYIVREMSKENFGVTELKQKIKNLRCTYNQERMKINKSQKSGSGSSEVYVSSLKWYHIMDTLLKSISRSTETRDNFEETIQSENAIVQNESQSSSVVINDLQQPTTDTTQNIEDSQSAAIQKTPILKGKGKGKTSKNKNLEVLSSAVNEVRKVHESLLSGNEILNTAVGGQGTNSVFGSYVALMLDKMSFEQSILAQSEIQSILVRFLLTPSNSNTLNASKPIHVVTPEHEQYVYVQEAQDDTQLVLQTDGIYIKETQDGSQSILQAGGNVQETQDDTQYNILQSGVNDQKTQKATESILNLAYSSANTH